MLLKDVPGRPELNDRLAIVERLDGGTGLIGVRTPASAHGPSEMLIVREHNLRAPPELPADADDVAPAAGSSGSSNSALAPPRDLPPPRGGPSSCTSSGAPPSRREQASSSSPPPGGGSATPAPKRSSRDAIGPNGEVLAGTARKSARSARTNREATKLKVAVRCRPLSRAEKLGSEPAVVMFDETEGVAPAVCLSNPHPHDGEEPYHVFAYDHLYAPATSRNHLSRACMHGLLYVYVGDL